jgi:carbamoylphosphate synthase large subunit
MLKANRQLSSNVAKFFSSDTVRRAVEREDATLPLIGRTNYHQGGKGLWTCLTKTHVEKAISDGAQYFQEYIDIKTEYRLHVFGGKIIYAVKKTENPTEAGWMAQRREIILSHAAKNNVDLNVGTIDYVLGRLVKEAVLPDRIVRSNKRGWKFSNISINTLPAALKNVAIKSVETVGLDFGAVDCAVHVGDHPFIIEINTGPGLQGTSFDKYVAAFREKIAEMERPPARRPIANRVANRVRRAVGAENADPEADEEALVHMMNAVRNPEEARRVLDLMNR